MSIFIINILIALRNPSHYITIQYNYGLCARYILTPYLVIIWAASAVYTKKTGKGEEGANPLGAGIEQINDYALAIIIIAVITFVLRTILVVVRTFKNPI